MSKNLLALTIVASTCLTSMALTMAPVYADTTDIFVPPYGNGYGYCEDIRENIKDGNFPRGTYLCEDQYGLMQQVTFD